MVNPIIRPLEGAFVKPLSPAVARPGVHGSAWRDRDKKHPIPMSLVGRLSQDWLEVRWKGERGYSMSKSGVDNKVAS